MSTADVARLFAFVREEPRDTNDGQAVRAFLKVTGLGPGYPWCAAFVSYVGRTLHGDRWPLKVTAGCAALGEDAKAKGLLYATPAAGDVFLLYVPSLKRFAHTGFVLGPTGKKGEFRTCEGNTNDGGSRDGWGVFERTRTFGPRDRFIRTGL